MAAEGYGHELLHAVIVAELTPLQREAFIDHAILGRTIREVADSCGVSHTTVRELCDAARRKLAASYALEVAA